MARRGRFEPDAPLAFALTGLMPAVAATLLPFVTVDKLRSERVGFLYSGAEGLWDEGMKRLAVGVSLSGVLAPIFLLATLVGLLLPAKLGHPATPPGTLWRTAYALEHWAMPEV